MKQNNAVTNIIYRLTGKKSVNSTTGSVQLDYTEKDLEFIYKTQPQGGLSFKNEFATRFGDSYSACIHVIDRPSVFVDFWIEQLSIQDNTIVIVDYYTPNKEYKKKLSDSISELQSRAKKATKQSEADDYMVDAEESRVWYQNMSKNNEKIKEVHMRIFVYAESIEKLEEECNEVLSMLDSKQFQGTVLLEENDEEYQSMFLPITEQEKLPSRRTGLPIPSEIMGLGFAHHQTALDDPRGKYYGKSFAGGSVYLDIFAVTARRTYYNIFLSGDLGMGKSTTLKNMLDDRAMRNDLIRVFGTTHEFNSLVESYNGIIINLDGSDGITNMYQIFGNSLNDDGTVNVQKSFSSHIDNSGVKYRLVDEDADSYTTDVYKIALEEFYQSIDMHPDVTEKDITAFDNTEYPILEDVYQYMAKRYETETDQLQKNAFNKIKITLKKLLNLRYLFNGHTTYRNVSHEQVVVYNTGSLSSYSSEIQDLQIFNSLTQAYKDCMNLGLPEYKNYNEKIKYMPKEQALEEARHWVMVVDECHNYINMERAYANNFFVNLMRESRKVFGGIWLATQRIDALYPDAQNLQEKSMVKAVNDMKQILSLCQYKFLLKHSAQALSIIKKQFGNTLSDTEYQWLPEFEKGQALLVIEGDDNILMNIEIPEAELLLFEGGA